MKNQCCRYWKKELLDVAESWSFRLRRMDFTFTNILKQIEIIRMLGSCFHFLFWLWRKFHFTGLLIIFFVVDQYCSKLQLWHKGKEIERERGGGDPLCCVVYNYKSNCRLHNLCIQIQSLFGGVLSILSGPHRLSAAWQDALPCGSTGCYQLCHATLGSKPDCVISFGPALHILNAPLGQFHSGSNSHGPLYGNSLE